MTLSELCESPVFIIGSPRSGTSVLAWALAHHSQFTTGYETDLLYELTDAQRLEAVYRKAAARPDSLDWLRENRVDEDEFLASIGIGLNALMTSRSSGRRWIDQTPANTLVAHTLARVFPGARFVHILRDGRRVVNSMVHFLGALPEDGRERLVAKGALPEFATDFRCACETWVQYVMAALEFSEGHSGRCLTVRNERLVEDASAGFDEIFSFLGVPPEPASAEFFRNNKVNSSFAEHLPPGGSDAAGATWDAEDQATFDSVAGPLQTVFYGEALAAASWSRSA